MTVAKRSQSSQTFGYNWNGNNDFKVITSGIVAGTVCYTKQLSVYGTSKQTEVLYNDIAKSLQPYTKQVKAKMPFEISPLRKTGGVCLMAKHYYYEDVKSSFHFVMLLCYTGRMIKKAKDAVSCALNAPLASASSTK